MASMTIRNLDEELKHALRIQAARNGVSMEAEARRLLERGLRGAFAGGGTDPGENAWTVLERIKAAHGGGIDFDIELPPRSDGFRRVVDFGE